MSEMIPADDQPDDTGEFLFYQTDDAKSRIELRLHDGNVWLTQRHSMNSWPGLRNAKNGPRMEGRFGWQARF